MLLKIILEQSNLVSPHMSTKGENITVEARRCSWFYVYVTMTWNISSAFKYKKSSKKHDKCKPIPLSTICSTHKCTYKTADIPSPWVQSRCSHLNVWTCDVGTYIMTMSRRRSLDTHVQVNQWNHSFSGLPASLLDNSSFFFYLLINYACMWAAQPTFNRFVVNLPVCTHILPCWLLN